MYLLEMTQQSDTKADFVVLGSTGNVYNVTIDDKISCTCPDALKGNRCKHAFFVLMRVLGVSAQNPILQQKSLTEDDFKSMNISNLRVPQTAEAPLTVKSAYQTSKLPVVPKNLEDCPICYEKIGTEEHEACKQCRYAFHSECLSTWWAHANQNTCPMCRSEDFRKKREAM